MRRRKTSAKSTRKPSQERAVATVEAILEAAARILEREGLTRLFGTNRIAREAGVSVGSLYEYFDSRDAIVRALSERHVTRVRALCDQAMADLASASLDQAADFFVDALFALHEGRPDLQRTLHHEFPRTNGLQPFIEVDQYVEVKLVEWLSLRTPEVPREELTARAFVAVRSVRAVTIHVFAEAVGAAQKERVRGEVKRLLVRTLEGG
jgi:AcrR family transcriptional regulator